RRATCKPWLDEGDISAANARHGRVQAAKPARLADGWCALAAVAAGVPEGDLRAADRLRRPAVAGRSVRHDFASRHLWTRFHLAPGRGGRGSIRRLRYSGYAG